MLKRRRFRRVPRLKGQTFNRLVPNIITVGALSAGLTAIRFAFEGRWQFAVTAILVAAVLDALDGRMARLLKSASDFGAELDSLSDVIAFGVAPAIVVYLWVLSGVEGPGWIAVLFFTVCCALRLARFNTSIDKLPPYAYNYFTGVPAPAGAGLAILPMISRRSVSWSGTSRAGSCSARAIALSICQKSRRSSQAATMVASTSRRLRCCWLSTVHING